MSTTGAAGSGGLREHKKQATRIAIHNAALSLVADRGLDGVTVDEICTAAEVSQRTFFNYYPSKAAAVLGMNIHGITEEDSERFLASEDGLVGDLCDLLGAHVEPSSDVTGLKRLASCQPAVLNDVGGRMHEMRRDLIDLATRRTGDRHTARLAVSLVHAALAVTLQSEAPPSRPEALGAALRGAVREMGELAREG